MTLLAFGNPTERADEPLAQPAAVSTVKLIG
jgi:hypothetical protein